MNRVNFRLASIDEVDVVGAISARAYTPVYANVIGAVPKPAFQDYRPEVERGDVWFADVDGGPVGVLVTEDAPDHLLIYSVAVEPSHQGKGIAKALLQHAEAVASAKARQELRLYTNPKMERNVRLYSSCGFAEIGRRAHPSRPGEYLVDMSKRISPRTRY